MRLLNLQKGASLIEVLISAVILSVGLLGMAGLQLEGTKKRKQAEVKAIAAIEANDLIDRMRANLQASDAKQYDMTQSTPNLFGSCLGESSGNCTPEQMAQTDLSEWLSRLTQNFPNGNGYICVTSNPGNIGTPLNCDGNGDFYAVSISWSDQNGENNEFRMSFKP